jgi:hypothetical protein
MYAWSKDWSFIPERSARAGQTESSFIRSSRVSSIAATSAGTRVGFFARQSSLRLKVR